MPVLNLTNINTNYTIRTFGDIVGIIIDSKSGLEYPSIIDTYSQFEEIFDDGEIELNKYKILFNAGYKLAPFKVVSEPENYATLRLTKDNNIPYCSPRFNQKYTQAELPLEYNISNKRKGTTNHFIIKYGDDFPTENGISYFFLYPRKAPDNSRAINPFQFKIAIIADKSLPDGASPANLRNVAGGIFRIEKNDSNIINLINEGLKNREYLDENGDTQIGGDGYFIREIDTNTYLYYTPIYLPKIDWFDLPEGSKLFYSKKYENDILSEWTENSKVIEFYSKFSGRSGSYISIKINKTDRELSVLYKGIQKENYTFSSLKELHDKIISQSKYLSCALFIDNLNLLYDGEYFLDNYIEETYTKEDIVNTVDNVLTDEYVDIDLFLYDFEIDHKFLIRLSSLAIQKKFISIINIDTPNFYYPSDNIFSCYGKFSLSGIEINTSYLFIDSLMNKFTSTINYDISIKNPVDNSSDILNELLKNKINHIRYDGY